MSIGQALAAAREAEDRTVAEVSNATRIRGQLIREIEADDFSGCGGGVYARGHIRAIATYLGLDPQPFLTEFDRSYGAPQGPELREVFERDEIIKPDRNGPNWTAAMAVAAAVLFLIAVVSVVTGGGGQPSNDAAHDLPTTPASGPSAAAPPPALASPEAPVAVLPQDGVNIVLRIVGERSWVLVSDERGALFQGVLTRGATKQFHATRELRLKIGNAGAVNLVVNGRDIGTPGSEGDVVRLSFGPGDPGTGAG
ncbi:MAG: helix-turn-helix domain-containing protein [Mycobacteriales bacterium]|nr:helix-turn-helix domain-containing protein [Frankia sp.]